MNKSLITFGLLAGVLVFDSEVLSRSSGMFPRLNLTLTRESANSCGGNNSNFGCHRTTPILTEVPVVVGQRVLNVNGTTSVRVSAVNNSVSGTRGGFSADVTRGALVAGTNTQTNSSGKAITHRNAFSTGRSWAFNYRAALPGLTEMFVVANAVNGNGRSDGGDQWALHSAVPSGLAAKATPVRLFVNAPGVRSTGPGCDDGYGNFSVLGAATSPTLGNSSFKLEAHGLPTSAQFMVMLSIGGGVPPFDMAVMGAPGCMLRTLMQLSVNGTTTPGNALRAEGRVELPLAIPNDPNLRGITLSIQVGALDGNPKRSFPMIVTNGIEMTIQ